MTEDRSFRDALHWAMVTRVPTFPPCTSADTLHTFHDAGRGANLMPWRCVNCGFGVTKVEAYAYEQVQLDKGAAR